MIFLHFVNIAQLHILASLSVGGYIMENQNLHKLGIDIGSTTVKIAVLNEQNEMLFADYERHFANIL